MKTYLYGAAVVAFLAILGGSYFKGRIDCQAANDKAIAKMREDETKRLEEVQREKDKRAKETNAKHKVVDASKDACLDAVMSPDVRMQLNGGKAK